jgi:uncharacterized membrane protein
MMQSFALLFNLGIIAVLAAVLLAIPMLSRREFMFGITVPGDLHAAPEGRAILHGYAIGIVADAGFCMALVLATDLYLSGELQVLGMVAAPLVLLCAAAGAYLRARRQARPHAVAADRRREVDLGAAPRLLDVLPRPLAWHALPYLLLGAAALWLGLHWQEIPAVYPDHVGLSGEVDGYGDKSAASVFMPIVIGLVSMVLAHGVMLFGLMVRRLPDTLARARLLNLALLQLMIVLACLFAWVSLIPLLGIASFTGAIGLAVFLGCLVATVLLPGITLIRGLHRIRAEMPAGRGDRTADAAWKLGQLYFNREDPSLFVEKRVGIGYTMNFAHPAAYVLVVGIVLLVVVILIGSMQSQHP